MDRPEIDRTGPDELAWLSGAVRECVNRGQHLSHAVRVSLVNAEHAVNVALEEARSDERQAELRRRSVERLASRPL